MAVIPPRLCPHCGAAVTVTNLRDRLTFFACPKCTTVGADSVQSAEEAADAARKRSLEKERQPKSRPR